MAAPPSRGLRGKIYDFLQKHYKKAFNIKEIHRGVGGSIGNVQQQTRLLYHQGLIQGRIVKRRKKIKHYFAALGKNPKPLNKRQLVLANLLDDIQEMFSIAIEKAA